MCKVRRPQSMPDGVCNPVRNVKSCVHQSSETSRTGLQTPSGTNRKNLCRTGFATPSVTLNLAYIKALKRHGRGCKPRPAQIEKIYAGRGLQPRPAQ
jgi:hypothetical protein